MLRGVSYRACAMVAICLLSLVAADARGRHRQRDVTDVGGSSCFVQGGGFRLRGSWPRSMVVASGSPCGGTFAAAGRVTFKRLYLTGGPQHGRVVLQEGGHYHYTSAAGYPARIAFRCESAGSDRAAARAAAICIIR
jgi:hypothetical protein